MIAEEQFPPQCEVDISDIVNVHMFGLNGEFLEGELKKAAELAYPWPLRVNLNKYRSLECIQMMRSMLVAQGVAQGSTAMHTTPVFFTIFLVTPVQDLEFGCGGDMTGHRLRGDNILLATTLGEAMKACGDGHFKRSALEHWLGLMTAPVLRARVGTPVRVSQPVQAQVDAPRFVRLPELVKATAVHPAPVEVDASPGGDELSRKPAKRKRYDPVASAFDTSLNNLQGVMEATFSTQRVDGVPTGTTREDVRADFVSIRAKTDTMVRKT